MTWQVIHLDIRSDPAHLPGSDGPAFVVFWWGRVPLGAQCFAAAELPLPYGRLLPLAARLVALQLAARLPELGAPARPGGDAEPIVRLSVPAAVAFTGHSAIDAMANAAAETADDLSVIVCTRNRPRELDRCLRALGAQRPAPLEVVVVDNSADASARRTCESFPGVRYVHEPRLGLSIARNTGIDASLGSLVAFTDDDVEVHSGWSAELARVFRTQPDVDAVTGLVLPSSLATRAQRFFQFNMGGFGSSYVPLRFDASFIGEQLRHGPQVWRIGAGANMAFRRSAFARVGRFDERLGAGASGCSEDSELWYRLLADGGCCAYEPRAVVFHHHRAGWDELLRQTRAYMKGHVSALVVQSDRHGHRGNLRRIALQLPRYFLRTAVAVVRQGSRERASVLAREVIGWAAGLQYLVRPGWRRRAAVRGGK
jgi:GT2 family glycosyltransferase